MQCKECEIDLIIDDEYIIDDTNIQYLHCPKCKKTSELFSYFDVKKMNGKTK